MMEEKKHKRYPQKFKQSWYSEPELSNWLLECPNDSSKAYCSICKLQLKAKLNELKKHAVSAKHKSMEIIDMPTQFYEISQEAGSSADEIAQYINSINSYLRSEIEPDSTTYQDSAQDDEPRDQTEFDAFGGYVACTLNKLPLPLALKLQEKINTVISAERLQYMQFEDDNKPHIPSQNIEISHTYE